MIKSKLPLLKQNNMAMKVKMINSAFDIRTMKYFCGRCINIHIHTTVLIYVKMRHRLGKTEPHNVKKTVVIVGS